MEKCAGVRTSVGVRVWATSTIYVANEALRTQMEIVGSRGLNIDYIASDLEVISKGYRTWLTTRHLKKAILEIYDPRTDKAVERWDLCFDYDSSGTGDPREFRTEMGKLKDFVSKLRKLPPGCEYHIIVELGDGAPLVQGWEPCSLRSIDHLKKKLFGNHIDTAKIKVAMEYWGET
jgi:hypothetical protein